MDVIDFCEKYCPIPFHGTYRDGTEEIDCDIEDRVCPFRDVNFKLVFTNTISDVRNFLTGGAK